MVLRDQRNTSCGVRQHVSLWFTGYGKKGSEQRKGSEETQELTIIPPSLTLRNTPSPPTYPTRSFVRAGPDVDGQTGGKILSGLSSRIEVQIRWGICILVAIAVVNLGNDGEESKKETYINR
jgi:hypothetical protein